MHSACPDRGLLKDHLDGLLGQRAEANVVGHLDTCQDCQKTLEELASGSEPVLAVARQIGAEPPLPMPRLTAVLPRAGASSKDEGYEAPESDVLAYLPESDQPGHLGRLGHYELLEVIGRGGMGIVFKAIDQKLQRVVAVKIMAPRLAASPKAHACFVREAQAMAALRDEHIIDIHAVEEANGFLYLVMEYIAGLSLQARLDRGDALNMDEIVRIGMHAAAGLAAAHTRGVIHGDIKPSNLLIEDGSGKVKITDFGLARAGDDSTLLRRGLVAGTPQYMAPEQARGEVSDHRADLFSLGSVLFTLCTGQPPFRGDTPQEVLREAAQARPCDPRTLNAAVPHELADVITRLHAADPSKRFPSAPDVARRLAQVQGSASAQTALTARKPRAWRRAAVCIGGGLVLALLVFGLAEGLGVTHLAALLTEDAPDDVPPGEVHCLRGHAGAVWSVAFAPDGRTILSTGIDGTARVWDRVTGAELRRFEGHKRSVYSIAITPDGKQALSGGGLWNSRLGEDWSLCLWGAQSATELNRLEGPESAVTSLALSRDGKQVLVGHFDGAVLLSDMPRWRETRRLDHGKGLWSVDFSPNGRYAVTAGGWDSKGTALVWNLEEAKVMHRLLGHGEGIWSARFAPDGRSVFTASIDRTMRRWDVLSGQQTWQASHDDGVTSIAFLPDGRVLSGSYDQLLRIWEPGSDREPVVLTGHTRGIQGIACSPNGRYAASGSHDGTVRVWRLPPR